MSFEFFDVSVLGKGLGISFNVVVDLFYLPPPRYCESDLLERPLVQENSLEQKNSWACR
eukprot:UN05938